MVNGYGNGTDLILGYIARITSKTLQNMPSAALYVVETCFHAGRTASRAHKIGANRVQ